MEEWSTARAKTMFIYKMSLTTENQTAQEVKKSPFGEKKDDWSR